VTAASRPRVLQPPPSSFRSRFFVPLDEAFNAASAVPRVITANNFLGPCRAPPAGVRPDAADGWGINPEGASRWLIQPPAGGPKPPGRMRCDIATRRPFAAGSNIERVRSACRLILKVQSSRIT